MIEIVKDKSEEIISFLENTGYFLLNEQEKHQYQTFNKEDGSLLTELDLASEMIIKNELKSLFGNIPVLSEENTEGENIEIAKQKYFFLLDPIDGTKSFNKGGEFTINLALCVDRKPVVSFIHNPIKKVGLFGDNSKAFIRSNGKITKLLKLKSVDYSLYKNNHQKQLHLACGDSVSKDIIEHSITHIQNLGYTFEKQHIKIAPALGKVLVIANGECDFTITSHLCKDWDVLPALPILNALNVKYYTANPEVYYNNNFNSGVLLTAKNNELLEELIPIFFNQNSTNE